MYHNPNLVDEEGIEPSLTGCKPAFLPLEDSSIGSRVAGDPGLEPGVAGLEAAGLAN